MTISQLALAAKRVIERSWLHGAPYDLASQAAFALESAQMLQSPETAASAAVSAAAVTLLDEAVAELKREHEENARLRARVTELETERHVTNEALDDAVQALRALERRPKPDGITRRIAPTQALREESHDSPLHHTYRVGRDLPETGGEA